MSGASPRKVEELPPNFESLGTTELKNLCTRMSKSIKELYSKREADAKTLASSQSDLYNVSQKLARVETAIERDKAQIEAEFEIRYKALVEEKNNALAAAETKDEENTTLTKKKEHYKASSLKLTQDNQKLENRLRELERVNVELRQKIEGLEADVLAYQNDTDKKNTAITEKSETIDDLAQKQSETEGQVADLKYKIASLNEELDEQLRVNKTQKATIDRKKDMLEDLIRNNGKLKESLRAAQLAIKEFGQDAVSLEDEKEEHIHRLESAISTLETEKTDRCK